MLPSRAIHALLCGLLSAALLSPPVSAAVLMGCLQTGECPVMAQEQGLAEAEPTSCCSPQKAAGEHLPPAPTPATVPDCCVAESGPPQSLPPAVPVSGFAPLALLADFPLDLLTRPLAARPVRVLQTTPDLPPWLLDAEHACATRGPPASR